MRIDSSIVPFFLTMVDPVTNEKAGHIVIEDNHSFPENLTSADSGCKRRSPISSCSPKSGKISRSVVAQRPSVVPAPALQTQDSVSFGKDLSGNLVCPICNKTFTVLSTANRHWLNVHNKILYKCEMCEYSCRKDYLKVHAMKNHGINEAMAKLMVQNCQIVQQ